MSKTKQTSFTADAFLYKRKVEFSSLPKTLEQILLSGAKEIRLKYIVSEQNLTESIPTSINHSKYKFSEEIRDHNFLSGVLSSRFGKKEKEDISGQIYLIQHPDFKYVWILISDSGRKLFEKPIKFFLRSIRPHTSSPVLTTGQIENILRMLSTQPGLKDLRVTQMGQRSRINSEGATKQIESDRKWTDLGIVEAFEEAHETGQWISDISIGYTTHQFHEGYLKIGRYGDFVLKNLAQLAFDSFANMVAKYAEERFKFLKDRNRRKETNYTSRPFNVNFDYAALNSKEQILKLSKTLHQIPSTTCTVLHGNPYFHAVIVDYDDGSTYEILVLGDNHLTVIPQGRTTVRALQQLCSYVFSEFREGELSDLNYAS